MADRAQRQGTAIGLTTLATFVVCVLVYGLTTYGGVRSPDNEVVFHAAESFADHLRLDVDPRLDTWDGFGVAMARSGHYYPVFGPGESIALAPFVWIARAVLTSGWRPAAPPPSFYVAHGMLTALGGVPMQDPAPHALRLLCSLYNVLVGAFAALAFLRLARRVSGSEPGALMATAFFALGSLVWPYTGTFFSEPLSLLLLLLAAAELVPRAGDDAPPSARAALLAGAWLGIACTVHVTAALAAPFLAALPIVAAGPRTRGAAWRAALGVALGMALPLALLGAYDLARFGSVFETGRNVDPRASLYFGYGVSVSPWRGLFGLTVGPCKGLVWSSPAVLVGLACWPALHRRSAALSWTLGAAVATRVLFVAYRSDWHGGFCVGPRLLVLALPFLLLPIAVATAEHVRRGDRRALLLTGGALVLCTAQQAYFCVGEVFSFLQRIRLQPGAHVFVNDGIYVEPAYTPLVHLLAGSRGPWLLRAVPASNTVLWLALSALLAALTALAMRPLLRAAAQAPPPRAEARPWRRQRDA